MAQAFSLALSQTLLHILTTLQGNASVAIPAATTGGGLQLPANLSSASQTPPAPPSTAGTAPLPMSLAAGNLVVPPFISSYCTLGNPIPSSQAAPSLFGPRSASSFSSPASSFITPHATPLSSGSLNAPSVVPWASPPLGKAFVVGPGYSPIPEKLVAKIRTGLFVELADLLAENLKTEEVEPQTFLDGKLVVSSTKKWVTEITDIITWVQAFTVYSWILCSAHPS